MNDINFSKSFSFRLLSGRAERHTDNSMGIPCHFMARMRCGSARFQPLSGEDFHVTEGDVFYLPQGLQYHSYWFPDEEHGCVEWESYGFVFFPNPKGYRYRAQRLSPDADALALLDRLARELTVSPATVGTLYLFLERVLPHMEQIDADPHRVMLERIRLYIEAHPDLCVPELAKHCRMSESGLYAFMRKHAGSSPVGLKNRLQIEKAVDLLRTTDLSVEEISARLGFCSSAYFRKIFKEQLGKTPTDLRKESHLI